MAALFRSGEEKKPAPGGAQCVLSRSKEKQPPAGQFAVPAEADAPPAYREKEPAVVSTSG